MKNPPKKKTSKTKLQTSTSANAADNQSEIFEVGEWQCIKSCSLCGF